MLTLKDLLREINQWQDETFTTATVQSAAVHLKREAQEVLKSILYQEGDLSNELADVFMLVAGVAHLAGIDLEQAVVDKLAINKNRVWGEPDADGVVEHVRGTLVEVFAGEKDDTAWNHLLWDGETLLYGGKPMTEWLLKREEE